MVQNKLDPSHFEAHIKVSKSELPALTLLAEKTPLSKQKLKSAMSKGCVWLESPIGIHRLRRAKKNVHENDTLHILHRRSAGLQSGPPLAPVSASESAF